MDGASFCPYPDYSWLGIRRTMLPQEPDLSVHSRQVTHVLFYAQLARADVRWIVRGHERGFVVPEHAVHFAAADGEDHVRIARVAAMHRFCVLLIPARHLDEIVSSEGCRPPRECRAIMGGLDPVLRMCMDRLAGEGHAADARGPTGTSTAARRLVLRLAELKETTALPCRVWRKALGTKRAWSASDRHPEAVPPPCGTPADTCVATP